MSGLIHKGETTPWGQYKNDMSEKDIKTAWQGEGTSIFDPVLCELCYRWFIPNSGDMPRKILDPFAGGSVRGIVASMCGYQYTGIELRSEQVEENISQIDILPSGRPVPNWIQGDSAKMNTLLPEGEVFDFLFSCPPYGDLEVYSELEEDISNMPHSDFISAYRHIIRLACARLDDDRFAVFVVGDYRNKKNGAMSNFVSDTIQAFLDCGLHLYNEIILLNAIGSLPVRATKQFNSGRKSGKCHQNVLVFYKGDTRKIKENFLPIDFSEINIENP